MVPAGYVIPGHPSSGAPGETGIVIYGYVPSLVLAVLGSVTFGICLLATILLLFRYRWNLMTFLTLVGTLCEVIGYIARSLSSQIDPYKLAFFVIQYFFIVVAPVFFAAAIYIGFGRLIMLVSSEASPVKPKTVFVIFLSFDVVTTILQIAGAAMIGSFEGKHKDPTPANDILLAGLAIQTASFAVFLVILVWCIAKFIRLPKTDISRFQAHRPLFGLLAAVALLVQLRTAFRLAETSQNVFGYLSVHEAYFGTLEFVPVILAVGGLIWLGESIRIAMLRADAESSPVESSPV